MLEPTKHRGVRVGQTLSEEQERDARARLATAEFVLDVILKDPDFGEMLDEHTRSTTVPGTTVVVIWTIDARTRSIEIITPFQT